MRGHESHMELRKNETFGKDADFIHSDAQLPARQRSTLDPVRNLPKCNVSCKIGISPVLRLGVDRERREAAIVRRAKLVLGDVSAGIDQLLANLFRSLDSWIDGVGDADEGDLLDTMRVAADALADLPVNLFLVCLARELDEEVSGIDVEHCPEKSDVGDVGRVRAVAVAARTGVKTNVRPLFRRETLQDAVDQGDECPEEELAPGLGVPRVTTPPGRKSALGEVDAHSRSSCGEAASDVLFALVHEILGERGPGVAINLSVRRISQEQEGWRDDSLLQLCARPEGVRQG